MNAIREQEKQFRLPYKMTTHAEAPEEAWKHTSYTLVHASQQANKNKQTNKQEQSTK